MMQLVTPKTHSLIPNKITIDWDELKRLKSHKLISDELYIGWAITLTFGKNYKILDKEELDAFCENWSFDLDEYIPDSKIKFKLDPEQVIIGMIKFSQKTGKSISARNFAVQLELNLEAKNF